MRIVIFTWGSMGDVVPMVALARRLINNRCEVVLGAANVFSMFVKEQGIPFQQVGSPFTTDEYNHLMKTIVAEPNPRKQFHLLLSRALLTDLSRQYQDCLNILPGADVVICHWMQMAGLMAAEKLAKRLVTVTLNPIGIENLYGAYQQTNVENNEVNKIALKLSDFLWGSKIHEFRRQIGLPRIPSVTLAQYSQELNLVAMSRHLFSKIDHWPEQHEITGFWFFDDDIEWRPTQQLSEFLDSGEKPVVISFGSMAGEDPRQTTAILFKAIRSVGKRVILQGGWGELGDNSSNNDVLCIDYAPHSWLFEHAACIVHHGGAGTSAAALRAGVPSVIVWHMFDQHFWGNRLSMLGLGGKPIARSQLTVEKLAKQLQDVLENNSYVTNCQTIAKKISRESGVEYAADMVCNQLVTN